MALAYAFIQEWLANLPARNMIDTEIAERAVYWGLTVPQLVSLMKLTGIYVDAVAPAAPAGFTANPGSNRVTLMWSAVTGAIGYNVKRASTGGTLAILSAGGNVTGTTFVDTTAVNGTSYDYAVSALNATGESANSATVTNVISALLPSPNQSMYAASYGGSKIALGWV